MSAVGRRHCSPRLRSGSPHQPGESKVAMNHKPIVVVGSINLDLVARAERIPLAGETVTSSDFQMHPGGKGANQAVAVARLGYPVRMIGRVGSDAFGESLRADLVRSGVDTAGVRTSQGPSGVAVISVARNGENAIVVTPGANALVSPSDVDENADAIGEAGVALAQLEIPMETVRHLGEVCARMKVPLILDPAPAKALPAKLLEHVSWLTPNETEIARCVPDSEAVSSSRDTFEILEVLVKRLGYGLVLKMGSRGVHVASKDGARQQIDAFPVKVVDTTGAGDAFNGAFAVGMMMGKSPLESARFAVAASAVSVTRAGAQPSMPTMEEVNRLRGPSS
jgi:ribokinase